MPIRVIRPDTVARPLGLYSHGAQANGLVVVAGQVGVRSDGTLAGADTAAQTRQAFANVEAVLAAAGCTMRDVIRFQTFLVSADDIPAFMEARGKVFARRYPADDYPPNTLLVISRLVRPELRVEIEALAAAPRWTPTPTARRARPSRRAARRR